MSERDEIIEELKHLVRYYRQASREFFDDASGELEEQIDVFYGCLEENKNSLEEFRKMVESLSNFQKSLGQKVEDLAYLTNRMSKLLETPPA